MSVVRRGKKEKYIHRWLREHPKLQIYLNKEEYDWLKKIADERGVSMKEVVFEAIKNAEKFYKEGKEKGYEKAFDYFIDMPFFFYRDVVERAEKRGLKGFEPCLFAIPCPKCGKPIVFTHKDLPWNVKVRPRLLSAFKDLSHELCELAKPSKNSFEHV